eukprot:756467-Pelagomonas_calceolata.AAC.1
MARRTKVIDVPRLACKENMPTTWPHALRKRKEKSTPAKRPRALRKGSLTSKLASGFNRTAHSVPASV